MDEFLFAYDVCVGDDAPIFFVDEKQIYETWKKKNFQHIFKRYYVLNPTNNDPDKNDWECEREPLDAWQMVQLEAGLGQTRLELVVARLPAWK